MLRLKRPRSKSTHPAPPNEAAVEREVIATYRLHGGEVYVLSQGFRGIRQLDGSVRSDPRGTRQTPGLADLEVFFHRTCFRTVPGGASWGAGLLLKHEVKTHAGMLEHARMIARPIAEVTATLLKKYRRAQAQAAYEAHCHQCGVPYTRGGVPEALALLVTLGIRKE